MKKFARQLVLLGSLALAGAVQAQDLTDGEVRKIDKDAGKLTLKHGPIKHMDMPGMTMVFQVNDKTLLDKVKVGEKVRFQVTSEQGRYVVTDIQAAP
jgi:Cu(I)/Ag(I) efflux system protein CusF